MTTACYLLFLNHVYNNCMYQINATAYFIIWTDHVLTKTELRLMVEISDANLSSPFLHGERHITDSHLI